MCIYDIVLHIVVSMSFNTLVIIYWIKITKNIYTLELRLTGNSNPIIFIFNKNVKKYISTFTYL